MDLKLEKKSNECLTPFDDEGKAFVKSLKLGEIVHKEFSRLRNPRFHRKYFALLNFAYDYFEPPAIQDNIYKLIPEKNFDLFRRDLTILAGYYVARYRVDGSVRIEAKSISFAKMDDSEFEKLYSSTINVILKHILINYDRDRLDSVVEELLSFD